MVIKSSLALERSRRIQFLTSTDLTTEESDRLETEKRFCHCDSAFKQGLGPVSSERFWPVSQPSEKPMYVIWISEHPGKSSRSLIFLSQIRACDCTPSEATFSLSAARLGTESKQPEWPQAARTMERSVNLQ